MCPSETLNGGHWVSRLSKDGQPGWKGGVFVFFLRYAYRCMYVCMHACIISSLFVLSEKVDMQGLNIVEYGCFELVDRTV